MTNQNIPQMLQNLFSKAVRVYMNPVEDRDLIRTDNVNKIGIYCWVNLHNNKLYVGRASGRHKQLYGRLQDYYQPAYLAHPRNATSLICRALLKYEMNSFALLILEYVNSPLQAILREEYYLNTLETHYNTKKSAGHSLGHGLGVPKTDKHKIAAWLAQWGSKPIIQGPYDCLETTKLIAQQLHGIPKINAQTIIEISDALYPDVYATFYSWRTAAQAISVEHSSLIKHVNNGVQRPYNGRYNIKVTKKVKPSSD